MATEVQTLILRFRDLATGEGETLALHQQIAKEHGYVWWGWWNKFGEQAPVEVFTELNVRMQGSKLELYLFDSGKNELRVARCVEIKWGPDRTRMRSPEPDRTPQYYKAQEYFAWFKFTEIDAKVTDPQVLNLFSYVQVPDFFESRISNFIPFYGKRIESVQELQNQNRTIWFIRPFKAGDRTGSVPVAPKGIPDSPFSTVPLASHSSTLLWLSDIHFGKQAFPLVSDPYERNLSQALEHDLKQNEKNSVAAVIVSGDLTWTNEKVEFDQSRDFLSGLRSWTTLDLNRILVSPGNHDFRFSKNPLQVGEKATVAAKEAMRGYSQFYNNLYGHLPNEFLSCGRRLLVGNAVAVDVVCLNSSLLEQAKDAFQGQGFIGDKQLTDAATQMNWDKTGPDTPRAFRVLVLHHHLLPVSFRPVPYINHAASITWDAEAVVRWIVKNKVDLVLHGHMHDPFFTRMARPDPESSTKWHTFHVAGLGSSGVDAHELGDERYNTYAVIEFGRKSVTIEIHRIDSKGSIQKNQAIVWTISFDYTHLS